MSLYPHTQNSPSKLATLNSIQYTIHPTHKAHLSQIHPLQNIAHGINSPQPLVCRQCHTLLKMLLLTLPPNSSICFLKCLVPVLCGSIHNHVNIFSCILLQWHHQLCSPLLICLKTQRSLPLFQTTNIPHGHFL